MPTYTNPQTIDLGTQKSAPELQSNFDALQAALNGGLDEVNVPNLAAAFTTWKTIAWGGGVLNNTAANTYFLSAGPTAHADASVQTLVGGLSAGWAVYFDPADWAANARTTRLRIRWTLNINAVSQSGSLTAGLYPVATWGGTSAQAPIVASTGAVVTGSTASFVTPAASSFTVLLSSEFNAPAAGAYLFGVGTTALAASSQHVIAGQLQMRQV